MDIMIKMLLAAAGGKLIGSAIDGLKNSRDTEEEKYAKRMQKLQSEMEKTQMQYDRRLKKLLEAEIKLQEKKEPTRPNIVQL